MILIHGTTRRRAEQILDVGPDPRFLEPGGFPTEDGFSMYLEQGPFHFGTSEEYAISKHRQFPNEGGPVILVLDIPEEVVNQSASDWFPLSQGLVQFDIGAGLEELLGIWPEIVKTAEIRSVK